MRESGGGFQFGRGAGFLLSLALLLSIASAAGADEPIGQPGATVAAPAGEDVSSGPQTVVLPLRRGETLLSALEEAGASVADARQAIESLTRLWNPRGMKAGQELTIELGESHLQSVRFFGGLDRVVASTRGADGEMHGSVEPRMLKRVPALARGVIRTSLYQAAVEGGMPPTVLETAARALSYDVDFQRELQPGNRFEVMYERILDENGQVVGNGNLLYASLELARNTVRIYRFEPPGGDPEYFDAEGRSARKALLRTPVDAVRITSGYGMRVHPILGYWLMHKGVDFGAPEGTPIMAAGDGIVERAGPSGNYGVFLLLRHNPTFETAYAHMSRIAAGIRPGVHVRQGQVIGYVGETGLATGPHLYYEVRINGVQVNPGSVKFQPGRNLVGRDLKLFHSETEQVDRELTRLEVSRPQLAAIGKRNGGF